MPKQGYVYILTNQNHTVLYTGVTSNLELRMYQHRNKLSDGFTKKYNCDKLLWWEASESIASAIAREKQIKAGSRSNKKARISELNPAWEDLSVSLFGWS